jgi:exocyst complex component 1
MFYLVGKIEVQQDPYGTAGAPSPSTLPPEMVGRSSQGLRPRTPPQKTREPESHRHPSPTPFSHLRPGASSRPSSPVTSHHKHSSSSAHVGNSSGTRHRPSSIMVQPPPAVVYPRDPSKLSAKGTPVLEEKLITPDPPAVPISQYPSSPKQGRKRGPIVPQAFDEPRRDQNVRISFYDPANQATLDRLITGEVGAQSDNEGDDENSLATMSNVEDMIEGYEWASDDIIGRKPSRATADLIEARLLNELMALEKVCTSESS